MCAVAMGVSASQRLFAVELMSEAERLNSLDDAWTLFLSEPADEFELQQKLLALQSMVGEMVYLLSSVAVKCRELEQITVELDTDLDRELDLLLATHPQGDLLVGIRPPRPFAAAVQEACQLIRREAPQEMADLTDKLRRISRGEFVPGDLTRLVKRALAIIGAAGGLILAVAVPGAIVIPVGLAVGAGIAVTVSGFILVWDSIGPDAVAAPAT
jgi:hypothetical protein